MRRKYLILTAILILAFFAGNFVYPNYFDKTVDFLNEGFSLKIPHFWTLPFRLGLDLRGGVSLVYEADLSGMDDKDKGEAMGILRDRIEQRVNNYGVAEPLVQVVGENRLIVELAGIKDVNEAIKMIGETPYLEFLEQRTEEETKTILDKIKEIEGKNIEEIQKIKNWELAFQNPYFKTTELTGEYLKGKDAAELVINQYGKPEIRLKFNKKGEELFEKITERNIGKRLAIFLNGNSIIDTTGDNKIDEQDFYSPYAPVVQNKITGGQAVITGEMNIQKAREIVKRLKDGALPVKIGEPISQQIVGPTLGAESLQKSIWAGIIGFLAIIIFLTLFYRLPGILASFALVIYLIFTLSIFKLFSLVPFISLTLTLAGVGGVILSIGMAVDANVLIFARMKEELKNGKSINQSIAESFKRAWPSIRDGNLTTLFVAFIFFFLGTSFIRGFALTLSIGIIVSMFSAMIITRIFLEIFEGTKLGKWKWWWG